MVRPAPDEWLLRAWKYLFPPRPLKVYGPGAKRVRDLMLSASGLHLVQFAMSLALFGFAAMIKDLGLACLTFSAYLTLKTWLVSTYLLVIATGSVIGFYQLLFAPDFPLLSRPGVLDSQDQT